MKYVSEISEKIKKRCFMNECKYCTAEDDWQKMIEKTYKMLSSDAGLHLYVDKSSLGLQLCVEPQEIIDECVKINFCPMCGRKLKEVE